MPELPNRANTTRKTLIDIARRRQVPGSGSDLAALLQRKPVARWPDLREALKGIPWAVVGAVATRNYMPERATHDLDIGILPSDSAEVRRLLEAAGYEQTGELAIGGTTWTSPSGVPIDVIEGSESWWADGLKEAAGNRDIQELPVLPLPYLVLMKMQASRLVDMGDVGRMLGLADDESLASVRTAFARYAPDLVDDLESLIYLGKLETGG